MADTTDDIIARLRCELEEFHNLIDEPSTQEQQAHDWLAEHDWIFAAFGSSRVVSEFRFGGQFRSDFVAAHTGGGPGVSVTCIELENPQARTSLTAAGQPNRTLSSAIRQVGEWALWIDENRRAFRELLWAAVRKQHPTLDPTGQRKSYDYLYRVQFAIVAGRRENADLQAARERKQQLARTMPKVDIMSYDHLIERAQRLLDWLSES